MAKAANKPAVTDSQIKPDELPVDLGGGRIAFVKRSDYAKRTAETFALSEKAEIKKDHVTQILQALDNGIEELPGENPEEIQKLFALVNEDYKAGIEQVREKAEKERAEAEEKERTAAEAKEKEEALYNASKDATMTLAEMSEVFDTGNMDRFIPRADVTSEQLIGALNSGIKMDDFTGWMIGDIVAELEKRGQLNVVGRLAEEKGIAYSKLYNDAKTAKAIPPDQRKPGISFTIYREIANAKFSGAEQERAKTALLNDVAEGKHTTQSVRKAVKAAQGKDTEKEALNPEEDPKFTFITYDPNEADVNLAIRTVVGFPADLFKNGVRIINPKTRTQFAKNGFNKKPENRWEALPVHEAPAEEKTAASAPKKGVKAKK